MDVMVSIALARHPVSRQRHNLSTAAKSVLARNGGRVHLATPVPMVSHA
jgi:hypothetical protein